MQADEAVICVQAQVYLHGRASRQAFEQAPRGEGQVAVAALQAMPFQARNMVAAGDRDSGQWGFERDGPGGFGVKQGGAEVMHFRFNSSFSFRGIDNTRCMTGMCRRSRQDDRRRDR
jgi:hypothetical protein